MLENVEPQRSGTPHQTPQHTDPNALFREALKRHQAGRLAEAEQAYRSILESQPTHFDSLHLLGVICAQRGDHREALDHFDKGLAINSGVAATHNNRGNALRELSLLDQALASYERAIALQPKFADAFYNRGNVLRQLKRLDEALASYERAIALKPRFADAFNNRGVV